MANGTLRQMANFLNFEPLFPNESPQEKKKQRVGNHLIFLLERRLETEQKGATGLGPLGRKTEKESERGGGQKKHQRRGDKVSSIHLTETRYAIGVPADIFPPVHRHARPPTFWRPTYVGWEIGSGQCWTGW